MEEFNKKSDEEIFKLKSKYLRILVFTTVVLVPMILFFSISLILSFFSLSLRGLIISIVFLVPCIIIYKKSYDGYGNYLVHGRDVVIESINKEKKKEINVSNEIVEDFVLKNESYPLTEKEVLDKLLNVDADFSKTQFYSYTKSLFTLIQEAWSNNDYQKLRAFEGDRLFNNHKKELIDLINEDRRDIRDKINIKGVLLKDFRVVNDKEILIVAITVSMTRLNYGEETRYTYPYIMAFSRNVGVKTNPNIELSTTNCGNCGAVIEVSDDGICNYCNTSLISGEHEWVLVDLKLLNKRGELI